MVLLQLKKERVMVLLQPGLVFRRGRAHRQHIRPTSRVRAPATWRSRIRNPDGATATTNMYSFMQEFMGTLRLEAPFSMAPMHPPRACSR